MASNVDVFDIVLSFDTTGSMSSCLNAVRNKMREMMRKLKSDIPGIRMGVIAHGDYDTDHTYIIKYEKITDDVDRLCQFVQNAKGTGGGSAGNLDEAYELALHYTRCKMDWRCNSNRVLVMIGDCRPHEYDYFLNKERIDWKKEVVLLRDMNVKINAVQCQGRSYADSFYQKIASTTFGHHVVLSDIKNIEEVIMSICYREAALGMVVTAKVQPLLPATQLEPLHMQELKTPPTASQQDSDSNSESDDEDTSYGMVCPMCKFVKPPNEFTSTTVSEDCDHAPLECMRCVVKHVTEKGTCPNETCDIEVDQDCSVLKILQAKLDRMFIDYTKGDARLSDYSIESNANISLIMPLYCVPEHLDHVVFDLSWEFPSENPDFLDATCFAFEKEEFVQVIDWTHSTNKYYLNNSIKHSEKNLTGPGAKTGHQNIHVFLKKVPYNITHLYFTLSSWRSPNLSAFRNPSLKFYEAAAENINLCETTFTHALNSQAVIMCSAVRAGPKWQIFECGAGSLVGGNSKCYNPIRGRIADLIKNEL